MSRIQLKKLSEQTIVITGASSGIGLCTARKAAAAGARLVLVARNKQALQQINKELELLGAKAITVVADVARLDQMQAAAQQAITSFGHIDTWINNAGVSIFGKLADVPMDEHRRLFDTNFWGVVNGSMTALPLLREHGGALINLGSELSDVAAPLQGMYSASKHAVKGFTDALRMELEEEGAPVSVTLIKPTSIDTLFVEHARNHLDCEPRLPSPIYAPDIVADAILSAAEHPKRDIYVGSPSKLFSAAAQLAPGVVDRVAASLLVKQQRSDAPPEDREHHSLFEPSRDGRERSGRYDGAVRETSLYTRLTTRSASSKSAREVQQHAARTPPPTS